MNENQKNLSFVIVIVSFEGINFARLKFNDYLVLRIESIIFRSVQVTFSVVNYFKLNLNIAGNGLSPIQFYK